MRMCIGLFAMIVGGAFGWVPVFWFGVGLFIGSL